MDEKALRKHLQTRCGQVHALFGRIHVQSDEGLGETPLPSELYQIDFERCDVAKLVHAADLLLQLMRVVQELVDVRYKQREEYKALAQRVDAEFNSLREKIHRYMPEEVP